MAFWRPRPGIRTMQDELIQRTVLRLRGRQDPRFESSQLIVDFPEVKGFVYECQESRKGVTEDRTKAGADRQTATVKWTKGVQAMVAFMADSMFRFESSPEHRSFEFTGAAKSPAATLAQALDQTSNVWLRSVFGSLEIGNSETSFLHRAVEWKIPARNQMKLEGAFCVSISRDAFERLKLSLLWDDEPVRDNRARKQLIDALAANWKGIPNRPPRPGAAGRFSSSSTPGPTRNSSRESDESWHYEIPHVDPSLSTRDFERLPRNTQREILEAEEGRPAVYHKVGRWHFVQEGDTARPLEELRPFWRDIVLGKFKEMEDSFIPKAGNFLIADVEPRIDQASAEAYVEDHVAKTPHAHSGPVGEWHLGVGGNPSLLLEPGNGDRTSIEVGIQLEKMKKSSLKGIMRRWKENGKERGTAFQSLLGEAMVDDKGFHQVLKMRARKCVLEDLKYFHAFARNNLPGPIFKVVDSLLRD